MTLKIFLIEEELYSNSTRFQQQQQKIKKIKKFFEQGKNTIYYTSYTTTQQKIKNILHFNSTYNNLFFYKSTFQNQPFLLPCD